MKVIVFTQAFNAEKTLPRAIDSILNQTFQNIEYYILDNASTDHTGDIIHEYAKHDSRVIPLDIDINSINHGGLLFWALCYASDADYGVWLDADDAYDLRFLEEITEFAKENSLDFAMCGYDMIDGTTGKIMKHRVSEKNLILSGKGFVDHFVDYRGFTATTWGCLFSLPFIKARHSKNSFGSRQKFLLYSESSYMLTILMDADRVGVYGKAMYQYYQYPHSSSRQNLTENLKGYALYIQAARQFLEHYGPISKVNEDFLYAIYLSFADEAADHAFSSNLPTAEKLDLLRLTFAEPLWAETLAREADPQFRNLAARAEYVAKMKERILALPTTPEEQALAERAVRELDKPIAGSRLYSAAE